MASRTVVTIGNFDGAHRGHAALIARARAMAGADGRVVALAFWPHPTTVLAPGRAPAMLSTFTQRAAWLRALGADEVDAIEPTPEMLGRTPEQFARWVIERFHPAAIVEGTDFHFGRGRAGSVRTLAELGRAHGFAVEVVEPVEVALTDQTIVTASSTMTRWLVAHGRVADAACVLGRRYTISGMVVRGDQRGRTIGFPTANLRTAHAIPGDGVYAGWAVVPGGRRMPSAIHVGPRATFDAMERTVEAFVMDWGGPVPEGGAEYGWEIELEFVSWIRGQARFDTVEGLVMQIGRDVQQARRCVERASARACEEALA